ncbi:LAQU0S08e04522g1_1 [Lachancea quebecensis]|uniref:LAQU0S08e04522g1_1 n=1 Tax=Lachancea quebecensis TaxID=1654605 RepID=A0A0N7MLT8_9SACH|nr:LAQU0S08e04522g1_1 [Lachancea quebecensis]
MFWSSKSNISSNYSYSSSPTFTAEPWSVHAGRAKNGSSANASARVSVFIFDKRHFENFLLTSGAIKSKSSSKDKQFIQSAYDILRAQVNQLAKLKHPNILALIEPLEEHSKNFMFVSEYVTGSLESVFDGKASEELEFLKQTRDSGSSDVVVQRGILQVAQGLDFIHNRANSVLLDLRPASVLVSENSDWKIAGLGHLTKLPTGSNTGQFTPDFNPRFPHFMHVPLNYSAPEIIMENMLTPKNDFFSLGLLIYFLYYKKDMFSCQDYIGDYKEEYSKYERDLMRLSFENVFSKVPQKLRFNLQKLMNRDVFSRFDNITEFLDIEFFQDPLVKTLAFLDDLPTKDSQERSIYLQGLLDILPQFPSQLLQKKFLTVLLELLDQMCSSEVIDSKCLNTLLTVVAKIGMTLSQLSFQERVYPHFVTKNNYNKLLENATRSLIDNIDIFQEKIKGDLFVEEVLKPLCTHVFSKINGEDAVHLQESLMGKLDVILRSFDFPTVKNFLFALLSQLFVKTTSLTVKSACVTSFKKMIELKTLDKYTCVDEVLPLFKSMKTRDSRILMKSLELLQLFPAVAENEDVLVEQVLPLLWNFSMAMTLKPNQYLAYNTAINKISADIQRTHLQKLKETTGHQIAGEEANFNKVIEKPIQKPRDPDAQASRSISVPAMMPKSTPSSHTLPITPRPRPKQPSKPLVLTKGSASAVSRPPSHLAPKKLPTPPPKTTAEPDLDDFDDFVTSPSSPVVNTPAQNSPSFPPGFSMAIQPQRKPSSLQGSSFVHDQSSLL